MAVYKSTYCSPLLENIDPRVVAVVPGEQKPCVWLKCKINSSNKKITGYSVRILDMDNNEVFPASDRIISPIEELPQNLGDQINSGLNGTMLWIPFFQNVSFDPNSPVVTPDTRLTTSENAIYYVPRYAVDHLLDKSDSSNDDWTYSDGKWSNDDWDSTLNGEPVYVGETVLLINANNYNGLFIIGEEGALVPYFDFDEVHLVQGESGYSRLLYKDADHPGNILVKHGDTHNQVWYWDGAAWQKGGYHWEKLDGTTINIDLEKNQYKWELTLYQGEGACSEDDNGALVISYENLSFEWYDMNLTQGTILGSTNKRIQIADDDGTLPSGEQNSPLVLQGRFIQLLDENSQPIAERSYIRSYDASFGHVYPTEGDFQLNWIDSAQKACFYKHSNKEEYVDPSERVRLASTKNIPIYIGDSSYEEIGDQQEAEEYARMGLVRYIEQTSYETAYGINYVPATEEFVEENAVRSSREETGLIHETYQVVWFQAGDNTYSTPLLEAHLYFYEGIGTINAEDITVTYLNTEVEIDDFKIIRPNELVVYFFVTKESSRPITTKVISVNIQAKNHKVWHYYKATLQNVQFNNNLGLQIVDGVQTAENDLVLVKNQTIPQENGVYQVTSGAWRRAAGFNTWGNFIGALLYVQEGQVNRATNWESTAAPLGSLFDLTSATSGNTPLYFKPESSIPLFLNKIKYGVDLVGSLQMDVPGADLSPVHIIDGVPLAAGNHVYNTDDNIIYTVDRVEPNGAYVSEYTDQIYVGDFLSVVAGFNYGNTVVKVVEIGDDPSTTGVLITTELNEAIIQKNTVYKTYVSPFIGAQSGMALKLLNGKTVLFDGESSDTSWIKINDINTDLWYVTHDKLATPLLSASVSDSSVPYKYELRSYFKTSDENPFYCYEAPYLKIQINGQPIQFERLDPYQVIDPILLESVDYMVNEGVFNVIVPGVQTINNRYVEFTGVYKQFQQVSWESYRWVLLNKNGDIIQDTGLHYDKEMSVTFYGLEDGEQYAAILYVVDDANNILTLAVYFSVDFEAPITLDGMNFKANFECSTHSVFLSFNSYGFTAPSFENRANDVSYKYIAENYDKPLPFPINWDNSYVISDGIMTIQDVTVINRNNIPVSLPLPNIYATKGTDESTGLSDTSMYGINYSQIFSYGENETIITQDSYLSSDIESENTFYFETQIKLSENYCGKFLRLTIGSDNTYIELGIPENFTDPGEPSSNYSILANRVYVKVNNSSLAYLYRDASTIFTHFYIPAQNDNHKFVLQRSVGALSEDLARNLAYDNFIYDREGTLLSLWYKRSESNNQVHYLNSSYDLGNIGLFDSDRVNPGPAYWSENRGWLWYEQDVYSSLYAENPASQGTGINLTRSEVAEGTKISDPEYMPYWPDEYSEDDLVWNESGINNQPASWDNFNTVGTSQQTLWEYIIRPRHLYSLLSQKFWALSIECLNVEALQSASSITTSGDTADYTTIVSSGGEEILKIRLIPIEEGGN